MELGFEAEKLLLSENIAGH